MYPNERKVESIPLNFGFFVSVWPLARSRCPLAARPAVVAAPPSRAAAGLGSGHVDHRNHPLRHDHGCRRTAAAGQACRGIDWSLAFAAGLIGSFVGGLLISLLSGDGLELRPSGIIGSIVGAVIVTAGWLWFKRRSSTATA